MTVQIDSGSTTCAPFRRPARWFVTAHTTRFDRVDGELVEVATSVAHAKEIGTDRTACGVRAWTWRKLMDVSFPPHAGMKCRACLAALAAPHRGSDT
ncbi:MAG: hypothetical protein CMH83_21195 [Nocardioides sp.]|nr:hypothetical protein [Nocardioides sp.]